MVGVLCVRGMVDVEAMVCKMRKPSSTDSSRDLCAFAIWIYPHSSTYSLQVCT
jgi:hypothetical protein